MAKNRFAISTVFDVDDRPFNDGIRRTSGTANVFARKTAKRFSQMAHDINDSMSALKNPFSELLAMAGGIGIGAMLSGVNAKEVLQTKYQAEAIGLTASELAAFTPIAKKAGLEVDNVTDLFEEMHNKLGMAKKGNYEAGLKDYGHAINMSRKELDKLLSLDTSSQFESIISNLDKMDIQSAIGIGDSLFGGEFNRFYRSYKTNFGDLNAAKEYWDTLNNLSDEGRKGNEEYAMSIGNLTTSLSTALDDLTGKFGHELSPAIDYIASGFNQLYQNGDHYLDLLNNSISEHLDLSMDNVSNWTKGAIALFGTVGAAWAAKKVTGKLTGKVKQTLGLDKDVQKVFVTNWPIGGSDGYDPGLENPFGNDKKKGSSKKSGGLWGGEGFKSNIVAAGTVGYMLSQADEFGSPINIRRKDDVNMPDWAENIPVSSGLLDVYDDMKGLFSGFLSNDEAVRPLHQLNQSPSIVNNQTHLPIIQNGLGRQDKSKKDSDNLEKIAIAMNALVINSDNPTSTTQLSTNNAIAIKAYQTNSFGD